MGVCLVAKRDGELLSCNWWNWRPTVALLQREGLPGDETAIAILDGTGYIVTLDAAEAVRAAEIIDARLAALAADARVLLDGSVTTEPDDGTFYKGADADRNYSATRAWLEDFRDFCRRCEGFTAS